MDCLSGFYFADTVRQFLATLVLFAYDGEFSGRPIPLRWVFGVVERLPGLAPLAVDFAMIALPLDARFIQP